MVLHFSAVAPSAVQFKGFKKDEGLSSWELSNESAVMKLGTLGNIFICPKLKLEVTYALCTQSIVFMNEVSQKKNKA